MDRAVVEDLVKALKLAEQFMSIASDWNLDEAEIDGVMRPTAELQGELLAAITAAERELSKDAQPGVRS